jgi:hypothetical protein
MAPKEATREVATITVYKNGFTVDGGSLRTLDDPNTTAFFRAVARGRVPRLLSCRKAHSEELEEAGILAIDLVDKRKEDYVKPERTFSLLNFTTPATPTPHGLCALQASRSATRARALRSAGACRQRPVP